VDDESMIGELVAEVLRKHLRCEVRNAKNGQEALLALDREEFDAIIVDYVMPLMNGWQLYQRLEQERPDLVPRLMFITGDVLSERTLSHIASTHRPLLEKPFGLTELTATLNQLIGRGGAAAAS
jgi:CheY-like chemotaxis protein